MLQFIVTNVLLISIGVILYVAARALPRLDETDAPAVKRTLLERWIASEIPHRLDELTKSTLWKLLRRLKVFLLRADNLLSAGLKKIKPEENGNGKPKIDFKELAAERIENGYAHRAPEAMLASEHALAHEDIPQEKEGA